jgi:hypothetical protein
MELDGLASHTYSYLKRSSVLFIISLRPIVLIRLQGQVLWHQLMFIAHAIHLPSLIRLNIKMNLIMLISSFPVLLLSLVILGEVIIEILYPYFRMGKRFSVEPDRVCIDRLGTETGSFSIICSSVLGNKTFMTITKETN